MRRPGSSRAAQVLALTIVIFSFSPSGHAQERSTGMMWSKDPTTRCEFVSPISLTAGPTYWVGACPGNKASGLGMLRRRDGDRAGAAFYGEMKNGVPVIEGVHIDTMKTSFLFDTGAPMCNIDVSIVRFELPGATVSKVIRINQLSFEPIFRVMDLDIIKQRAGCTGVLGNNFLADYTVCINRTHKTIYLRYNNADTSKTERE